MCVFNDRLLIPLFVHFISGMMTMQKFVDFKHNITFGEIKYLPQHFAFGFSKELIHWWVHVSNSWIGLPCSYMDVSPSNQILLKCLKKNWKRKNFRGRWIHFKPHFMAPSLRYGKNRFNRIGPPSVKGERLCGKHPAVT